MGLFNFRRFRSPAPKLGLALGGGGTRGFGHIGAIKAFEEHGISFNIVAGTSAGSIVGALYSAGATSQDMYNAAHSLSPKDLKRTLSIMPIESVNLENFVDGILGGLEFSALKRNFTAVAVDLITARQILLKEGNVAKAVSASCAVPVIFRPVVMGGMHLVDGGLLNNIPSDVVRVMGADKVVAIDVGARSMGTDSLKLLDIVGATIRIMGSVNSSLGKAGADVLISPDLSAFRSNSKQGYEEMINIGYNAALKAIPAIKALMV